MQVDAGFIVFGADSAGKPTGRFTDEHAALFDEAALRANLRRWLPEPLDLAVAVHTHDSHQFAILYVGRNPKGCAIFDADGQYGAGKQVTVFRKGDIFVRHGSASERAQHHDLDRIWARAAEASQEQARARFGEDLTAALGASQIGQAAADAQAGKRLDELEEWQGWEGWPVYCLQALPPAGTRLDDLHEPDGLRGAVQHMKVLRPNGFNLRPRADLEVRAGGLAYLADPRRAFRLDSDGTLTAGALATYDYLGWGLDSRTSTPGQVPLNSIVLVEFTLEFFRFVHRELLTRARPGPWRFRVVCRRMKTGPPMGPGHGTVALGQGTTPKGS
jgi:hypothetical protein